MELRFLFSLICIIAVNLITFNAFLKKSPRVVKGHMKLVLDVPPPIGVKHVEHDGEVGSVEKNSVDVYSSIKNDGGKNVWNKEDNEDSGGAGGGGGEEEIGEKSLGDDNDENDDDDGKDEWTKADDDSVDESDDETIQDKEITWAEYEDESKRKHRKRKHRKRKRRKRIPITCSRVVILLHIHKAGGTSVLSLMKRARMQSIHSTSAQFKPPLVHLSSDHIRGKGRRPPELSPIYSVYGGQCDQLKVTTKYNNRQKLGRCSKEKLIKKGIAPKDYQPVVPSQPLQLSDVSLWNGIRSAGVDYVAFEYNFLPPSIFVDNAKIRPAIASIALLRNPWERFQSTYHRELFRRCSSENTTPFPSSITHPCLVNNTLEKWMNNTDLLGWTNYNGILEPNYMVRMLNGLIDQPEINLTRLHLELAKQSLEQFDLVLYIEMPEEDRLAALGAFFGTHKQLKHISNNILKNKHEEVYSEIKAMSMLSKPVFEKLNSLDIELYDFTKKLVDKRRKLPIARC